MSKDLDNDMQQIVDSISVLSSDVKISSSLITTDDTQFARRAYIRSVFALFEGNLNLMANSILRAKERSELALSIGEVAVLQEVSYELRQNGKVGSKPKFYTLQSRLRFITTVFVRLHSETSFELVSSGQGWEKFNAAIKIRHRITHPRNSESFEISDTELDTVKTAQGWYADTMENMLEKC